jgi:hypothetical protein
MELSLARVDLMQVGSTSVNTMKILPLGKKKLQKVMISDSDGLIQAPAPLPLRSRPPRCAPGRLRAARGHRGTVAEPAIRACYKSRLII